MKKRMLSALLLLFCLVAFSSCGKANEENGRVYYLSFKPEQDAAWQKAARTYTKKTGIPVTVLTAADGQYESTLTTEMGKRRAPTLFQVNGPAGLSRWKNYCFDLKNETVAKEVTDEEFLLADGTAVYGVAYAVETYGLLYNKTLLNAYFASDWSSVKSLSALNSFTSLATVAREIQAHRSSLGVDGAFTSSGMDASSDWRFKTHLANLPIYYEYRDRNVTSAAEMNGTYLDHYKAIWDLYLDNATVDRSTVATRTGNDAQNEFATRRAVFYQNGSWALAEVTGNGKLNASEVGILPIYIGAPGEENQGYCTGSENYWCVNKNADEKDRKATLDFLAWLVTDEEGTKILAEDMGFHSPFRSARPSNNAIERAAAAAVEAGLTPVPWAFSTIPTDAWKTGVGAALTAYAQGKGSFDAVRSAFVDGWKREYQNAGKS